MVPDDDYVTNAVVKKVKKGRKKSVKTDVEETSRTGQPDKKPSFDDIDFFSDGLDGIEDDADPFDVEVPRVVFGDGKKKRPTMDQDMMRAQ